MAQAATPGGLWLPCSPEQAVALYQRLFQCPAGLGQLQAALRQVQEVRACPSGLELPTVLLQMEQSRRAQEQLLWDLELLTGAGLGLFWPPRAQLCGLRDQAQSARSQHSEPGGRMGGHPVQLMSGRARLCSSLQAGDTLTQNHQFLEGSSQIAPPPYTRLLRGLSVAPHSPVTRSSSQDPVMEPRCKRHLGQPMQFCRGQAEHPSSAPDLGEAGSDTDPRWKSPDVPAAPTRGCLQELDPTTSGSFGERGNSEFQNLVRKAERGHAEPIAQRPLLLSWGNLKGRKLAQEALGSSGLPEPGDTPERLGWSLYQDRTELQKLLGIETPWSQREEDSQEQKEETSPQGQGAEAQEGESKEVPQRQREPATRGPSGEATQALRQEISGSLGWETPPDENKDALRCQKGSAPECLGKETPQGQEVKNLQPCGGGGQVSQACEVVQEEVPIQPGEEELRGISGISRDFGRSLGEQMPQPEGRSTQLTQDKADGQRRESALAVGEQGAGREGALAPLRPRRPLAWPQLPGPAAVTPAALSARGSVLQERPTALPGYTGLVRNRHGLLDPGTCPGWPEQLVDESEEPQVSGSVRFPGALKERRGAAEVPKASKASWPGSPGREKASEGVSAALQRLLELHGAARRRRRQDREQQRLRVLERLRVATNRHCRVHPLGPPPSPALLPPQEDAAGQRRALREQLEQVHQARTRRLRAFGARNTQNFQQLLCPPGAEEPEPGE